MPAFEIINMLWTHKYLTLLFVGGTHLHVQEYHRRVRNQQTKSPFQQTQGLKGEENKFYNSCNLLKNTIYTFLSDGNSTIIGEIKMERQIILYNKSNSNKVVKCLSQTHSKMTQKLTKSTHIQQPV